MTERTREASTAERTPTGAAPANWRGVFAMSLCVFALIASEFMPVSLLAPIEIHSPAAVRFIALDGPETLVGAGRSRLSL